MGSMPGMAPLGSFGGMQPPLGAPMPGMPGMPPGSMGGYPGSRPGGNVPLMPGNVARLPQAALDSMQEDGAVSVAVDVQQKLLFVGAKRPSPATNQFMNRWYSNLLEQKRSQPRHMTDICGWVQAAIDPVGFEDATQAEAERMNIRHNEDRLVYAATNGWTFQFWTSQDDFEHGVRGPHRGGSRPISWWDLRKAYDVMVDISDIELDNCPHRIAVLTRGGNIFFRVEFSEDVPLWYFAIRRIIQDSYTNKAESHDTRHKELKRWPAAVGVCRALIHGEVIGSRAMAVLFHAYDIDYNCGLELGELMLLIKELYAAQLHLSGRAEADSRDGAIFSAQSRLDKEEQFERAVQFRRVCDKDGNGTVEKDEFIRWGQVCMVQAVDMSSGSYYDENGDIKLPGHAKDACSVM